VVKFLVASTSALMAVLLTAGCGLGPATPSAADAQAVPPPRRAVHVEPVARTTPPPPALYPLRETTRKDRKGALVLLLLGTRR